VQLDGGILENFGRLFRNNLKLFVYPYIDQATKRLVTIEQLDVPASLKQLYGYLVDRRCIVQLTDINHAYLNINSQEVLNKISSSSAEWEAMVPPAVAAAIKSRRLFGYA
jgi:hypothetical protein